MFRPSFAIALAILPASVSGQVISDAELRTRVDSFVSRRVADDAFSGVVLVARKGTVVYQRAARIANRQTGAPINADTRLQIASMTKLFTSIAIRQLDQAGKLALSDTVGKFLPGYPNADVRRKVTIEQLLRHQSGVGSFWNERFMARRGEVRTVGDYLELFQNDPLLFEPGARQAYSNGGYVLLGAVIERVSGKSYHDYLRDNVFRPAGMTQTTPYDRRVTLANAAVGYTSMSNGPVAGDQRLAGVGEARPVYSPPSTSAPAAGARGRNAPVRRPDSAANAPSGGMRLRIQGADGRELSPEQGSEAVARRTAMRGPRRPNTSFQAAMSSPAGDHFSTAGDLLKLANALASNRLLDSGHTTQLMGQRFASGTDYRSNGGGPGVNAELSIYPTGDVMIVLSNYDPPSATDVAEFIRALLKGA